MLQDGSAVPSTCAARWYAASAADGMPLVEALLMTCCSLPLGTPGASSPGAEMLAGSLTACDGTWLPSGSWPPLSSAAVALVTAKLAVHAPDRTASGTSAVAFCQVVMRLLVMSVISPLIGPGTQRRLSKGTRELPLSVRYNYPPGAWLRREPHPPRQGTPTTSRTAVEPGYAGFVHVTKCPRPGTTGLVRTIFWSRIRRVSGPSAEWLA